MAFNIAQVLDSPHLDAQDSDTLQRVWQTIQVDSCPTRYNFHMHTIYSDGKLPPENLAQQACEIGLQGFAITDHHSLGGYYIAQSWLEEKRRNTTQQNIPHLWTGVEITSQLLNVDVHILGYAFDPQNQVMQPYLKGKAPVGEEAQAKNVINAIHQAEGLAVLAHPARYKSSAEELIQAAAQLGIDGVETYYAYRNTDPWQSSPLQTEQVQYLSQQYNLLNTCGTDTHGLDLRKRI